MNKIRQMYYRNTLRILKEDYSYKQEVILREIAELEQLENNIKSMELKLQKGETK